MQNDHTILWIDKNLLKHLAICPTCTTHNAHMNTEIYSNLYAQMQIMYVTLQLMDCQTAGTVLKLLTVQK